MTKLTAYLHIETPDLSEHLGKIWEFSLAVYISPIYKSGASFVKSLNEFKPLIEPVFSELSQMSECMESAGKFSFTVITKASKGSKTISTVFKFIFLKDLSKKIKKAFETLKKSFENGDNEQIFDAELKFISVIGKCIEAPKIICKFLDLIPVNITPIILKTFIAPLEHVSIVFSCFSLVEEKRSLDATNRLIEELNSIEEQIFLNYSNKYLRIPSVFSGESTEVQVKSIKKAFRHDPRIAKITVISKRAFLKGLADRISEDPTLIKTHFKISEDIDCFAKLQGEDVQRDSKKLNRAVKLIKMRLDEKTTANKCALFSGACGVYSSGIAIFQIIGLAFPPLTFVATVAQGVGPLVTAIATIYEYHRKNEFTEAMMEITCAAA